MSNDIFRQVSQFFDIERVRSNLRPDLESAQKIRGPCYAQFFDLTTGSKVMNRLVKNDRRGLNRVNDAQYRRLTHHLKALTPLLHIFWSKLRLNVIMT